MEPEAGRLFMLVATDRLGDRVTQVEGNNVETDGAGLDSKVALQAGDQLCHPLDLLQRDVHCSPSACWVFCHDLACELQLATDRRKWRLELVDHRAEQVRFRPFGCQGLGRVRRDRRSLSVRARRRDRSLKRREEFLDHERLRHDAHETRFAAAA